MHFVQGPKEVVMISSSFNDVRHIYLADKHSDNLKPSWYGESIGHYEGDTLVVDTIGLNDRTFVDGFETPHTTQLHVIERFHLIEDGKVLEVERSRRGSGRLHDAVERHPALPEVRAGGVQEIHAPRTWSSWRPGGRAVDRGEYSPTTRTPSWAWRTSRCRRRPSRISEACRFRRSAFARWMPGQPG